MGNAATLLDLTLSGIERSRSLKHCGFVINVAQVSCKPLKPPTHSLGRDVFLPGILAFCLLVCSGHVLPPAFQPKDILKRAYIIKCVHA